MSYLFWGCCWVIFFVCLIFGLGFIVLVGGGGFFGYHNELLYIFDVFQLKLRSSGHVLFLATEVGWLLELPLGLMA